MNRQTPARRDGFRPQPRTVAITTETVAISPPQPVYPRRLRTSLGLCVVAAVVAFAVICVLGHDTPARAQPPNAPITALRAGIAPQDVATRAGSGRTADPTADPSAGAAAATDWLAGGGQAELAALEHDFAHLVTDARSAPATATARFAQDCADLARDASDAQRAEPIPDPQAQASWSRALRAMRLGADTCVTGAARADAAQLNQGLAQAAAGTADINDAATRFQELIAPGHA